MKFRRICTFAACLGFLLGIYKGKIALWKQEDPLPVKVFPIKASSLPRKDQELLQQGIPIDDSSELAQLLEDLLS